MQLTCPVCRAANDAGSACRRCRADLSLCFAVEADRECALAVASAAAGAGRLAEALAYAGRAAALRRGPDADRLRATAHLLAGDYAAAWNGHHRMMTPP